DAVGIRVRRLRLQGLVAACIGVVLAGRAVEGSTAQLRTREAGVQTGLVRSGTRLAGESSTARIAVHVEQHEAPRREQLDDVRRTHRALVARAEADVFERRVLHAELVRVRRGAGAVIRV